MKLYLERNEMYCILIQIRIVNCSDFFFYKETHWKGANFESLIHYQLFLLIIELSISTGLNRSCLVANIMYYHKRREEA